MPETAIGYFPDVGASFFLNTLPMPMARFLALTGYALSPQDAVFTGMATCFVESNKHRDMQRPLADGEDLNKVLGEFGSAADGSRLAQHADVVQRCFSTRLLHDIKEALREEQGEFATEARARLDYAAPSSCEVTIDLLDRTEGLPLAECLAIELDLARRVTRGPDFAEGIRALLVDKDRAPRWASVAEPRNRQ